MKLKHLLTYPNRSLRKIAEPIANFDQELHSFATEMLNALKMLERDMLSAPEWGLSQRILAVRLPDSEASLCMINPEIIEKHGEEIAEEDCLSFPGLSMTLARAKQVKLKYQDLTGSEQVLSLEGSLAYQIQHQIDHLNGVLFIDYLSKLKSQRIIKKWEKWFAEQQHAHCHDHTCTHDHAH